MAIQPQIKWAQRKATVFVTVEVMEASDVAVEFGENSFTVRCKTAAGEPVEARVALFAAVKPEECRWTNSRGIVLHLTKAEAKRWPSFTAEKPVPRNLKVDWAKWMDTDDEEEAEGKGGAPDFDMSQFGGMGGGMDFSQFGGMPGMDGGMPDLGSEDDDEEEEDEEETTAGASHVHGADCDHEHSKKPAAENAENHIAAASL